MTCHNCNSDCKRSGKHRNGLQRYSCKQCRKTFTEDHAQPLGEMRLPMDKAESILKLLVEGMSIRSIERVTQVHRDTIMRLLLVAGERCQSLMDDRMRNLRPRYLQIDEIWCYVGKKRRNVRTGDSPEVGDQWVFVAIDAESKLVPSFHVGKRHYTDTVGFLWDLYKRMEGNHVQITTDGLNHYTNAVPQCFGTDADFAQLTKMFGDHGQFDSGRYSPPRISGVISKVRQGDPDPDESRRVMSNDRT